MYLWFTLLSEYSVNGSDKSLTRCRDQAISSIIEKKEIYNKLNVLLTSWWLRFFKLLLFIPGAPKLITATVSNHTQECISRGQIQYIKAEYTGASCFSQCALQESIRDLDSSVFKRALSISFKLQSKLISMHHLPA